MAKKGKQVLKDDQPIDIGGPYVFPDGQEGIIISVEEGTALIKVVNAGGNESRVTVRVGKAKARFATAKHARLHGKQPAAGKPSKKAPAKKANGKKKK